jgi:hypothetical protein
MVASAFTWLHYVAAEMLFAVLLPARDIGYLPSEERAVMA